MNQNLDRNNFVKWGYFERRVIPNISETSQTMVISHKLLRLLSSMLEDNIIYNNSRIYLSK